MSKRRIAKKTAAAFGLALCVAGLTGCGQTASDGKIEVELVSYKPEAVSAMEKIEARFNETHDDIHLTIESPNEAMTILKTRFIRENYPDIVGIGGDINYSSFLDAELFMDISDLDVTAEVKPAYAEMEKELEFIPQDGIYALPYVANAAGVLYNKDMFEEHGWEIPETWDEFMDLCEEIKPEGVLPMYFGFKDTWTCLAPWNALAVDLAPADVCKQVNRGETKFTDEYREIAEKMLQLVEYGEEGPFAYGYNDACTAFANGECAMYTIGSYAVPQIKSVNPDMNIDSFVMPGSDEKGGNVLNSGVDLQFCVTSECKNKEAAYEVLDFLLDNDNIQMYLDDQNAVPCKDDSFKLASEVDGMTEYIEQGIMSDYQDHYYPSEMAVDAQIQTFLINQDVDAFLAKFDKDWLRYNRDIIRLVEEYEAAHGNE